MLTTHTAFAPRSQDNIGGALFREATVTRAPADAQTAGALEIALSSEAAVERWDWRTGETYLEVLDHSPLFGPDLTYARDGLPFCMDHSVATQIGLVESLHLGADRVLRGVVRQGNQPEAEWIFEDMRDGIRKKISIGYWPGETYTQEKNAQGQIVRRYTGWTLYEASSVTIPADYEVGVGRSARGAASDNRILPEAAASAHTMESPMAEPTTPVAGTVPAPDTRAADLSALAVQYERTTDLPAWIRGNTTVEQAKDLILTDVTARNNARPVVAALAPAVDVGKMREEDKPWDAGEFYRAVVSSARSPQTTDVRLLARGQNTMVGADGGFAVPPGEVSAMLTVARETGELWNRCTSRPITVGNDYTEVAVKEDSRANGSRNGGIQHYWLSQGAALTESDAEIKQLKWTVNKVGVYVKLTEEQIEDGPAMLSYINEVAPEELRFGVERCIWEGLGNGQPYGVVNSGALVQVAIEGSQTIANTAASIWVNTAKMLSRIPTRRRGNAVFFINDEMWAKILTATSGSAATPMFTAPGLMAAAPNGAIWGRPIVPIEYASAEGTVGDIVCADMSDYLVVDKGGIKAASSMHVEFVNDKQVLKFTYRVDGAPRTRVAQTPFKGSATKSPYVALAVRS
jgi:HK97 family phage major capsid protein